MIILLIALWSITFAMVWMMLSALVSRMLSAAVNRKVEDQYCGIATKIPPYDLATFGVIGYKTFWSMRSMCEDTGHMITCNRGHQSSCAVRQCNKCLQLFDGHKKVSEAFYESWSGMWRPPFWWKDIIAEVDDLDELISVVEALPKTEYLSRKQRKEFFVGLRKMHLAITDKDMTELPIDVRLGLKYPGFFGDDETEERSQ